MMLYRTVMKNNSWVLELASDEMKNNGEIVMAAVKHNGAM